MSIQKNRNVLHDSSMMDSKKIALIVHPLFKWSGTEYYLKILTEIFPNAAIFTAWYDKRFIEEHFKDRYVTSSFLQKIPFKRRLKQELMVFLPAAYRSLTFKNYALVISISDGFNKNIFVEGGIRHWIHILSPPRYVWLTTQASVYSSKIMTSRA